MLVDLELRTDCFTSLTDAGAVDKNVDLLETIVDGFNCRFEGIGLQHIEREHKMLTGICTSRSYGFERILAARAEHKRCLPFRSGIGQRFTDSRRCTRDP